MEEKKEFLELVEKVKRNLGPNFKESDSKVLTEIVEDLLTIASNISHRKTIDKKLYPLVNKASRAEYIARGNEGISSNSEGGISNSYYKIVDELKADIISNRLRVIR